MPRQHKFPKFIEAALDIAIDNITRLPCDQWDEITEEIIIRLKECAEKRHSFHGLRYLADIEEDIENMKAEHIYTIVKRKPENYHAVHC